MSVLTLLKLAISVRKLIKNVKTKNICLEFVAKSFWKSNVWCLHHQLFGRNERFSSLFDYFKRKRPVFEEKCQIGMRLPWILTIIVSSWYLCVSPSSMLKNGDVSNYSSWLGMLKSNTWMVTNRERRTDVLWGKIFHKVWCIKLPQKMGSRRDYSISAN